MRKPKKSPFRKDDAYMLALEIYHRAKGLNDPTAIEPDPASYGLIPWEATRLKEIVQDRLKEQWVLNLAVPINEQIACVTSEIQKRKHVYQWRIQQRKMTKDEADREISGMTAVLRTLIAVRDGKV